MESTSVLLKSRELPVTIRKEELSQIAINENKTSFVLSSKTLSLNSNADQVSTYNATNTSTGTNIGRKPAVNSVFNEPNAPSVTNEPNSAGDINEPNSASVIDEPNSAGNINIPNAAGVINKPNSVVSDINEPNSACVISEPNAVGDINKPNAASVINKPNAASVINKPNAASVINKPSASVINKSNSASVINKSNSASVINKSNSASVIFKSTDTRVIRLSASSEVSQTEKSIPEQPSVVDVPNLKNVISIKKVNTVVKPNLDVQPPPKSTLRSIGVKAKSKRISGEKGPHICVTCQKSFRYRSQLITHERIHSEEKPFGISQCDKRFRVKQSLKVHEESHVGAKYCCQVCDEAFLKKKNLKEHERSVHPATGRVFVCSECNQHFEGILQLSLHELTHQQGTAAPKNITGKGHIEPKMVKVPGKNRNRMIPGEKQSKSRVSRKTSDTVIKGSEPPGDDSPRKGRHMRKKVNLLENNRNFPCARTSYKSGIFLNTPGIPAVASFLGNNSSVQDRSSTGNQLSVVKMKFRKKRDIADMQKKENIMISQPPEFQTPITPKKLPRGSPPLYPGLPPNTKITLQCTLCPYNTDNTDEMKIHHRIHSSKPFSCSFCPETFQDSGSRNEHEKSHTEEKKRGKASSNTSKKFCVDLGTTQRIFLQTRTNNSSKANRPDNPQLSTLVPGTKTALAGSTHRTSQEETPNIFENLQVRMNEVAPDTNLPKLSPNLPGRFSGVHNFSNNTNPPQLLAEATTAKRMSYACILCPQTFSDFTSLNHHLAWHEKSQTDLDVTNQISVSQSTSATLLEHISAHVPDAQAIPKSGGKRNKESPGRIGIVAPTPKVFSPANRKSVGILSSNNPVQQLFEVSAVPILEEEMSLSSARKKVYPGKKIKFNFKWPTKPQREEGEPSEKHLSISSPMRPALLLPVPPRYDSSLKSPPQYKGPCPVPEKLRREQKLKFNFKLPTKRPVGRQGSPNLSAQSPLKPADSPTPEKGKDKGNIRYNKIKFHFTFPTTAEEIDAKEKSKSPLVSPTKSRQLVIENPAFSSSKVGIAQSSPPRLECLQCDFTTKNQMHFIIHKQFHMTGRTTNGKKSGLEGPFPPGEIAETAKKQNCPHCLKVFQRKGSMKNHFGVCNRKSLPPRLESAIPLPKWLKLNSPQILRAEVQSSPAAHLRKKALENKKLYRIWKKGPVKVPSLQSAQSTIFQKMLKRNIKTSKRGHEKLRKDNMNGGKGVPKRFQCKACPYSCTTNSNLRKHQLIHKNLRPFKCSYNCGRVFTHASNQYTHERRVHGEIRKRVQRPADTEIGQEQALILPNRRGRKKRGQAANGFVSQIHTFPTIQDIPVQTLQLVQQSQPEISSGMSPSSQSPTTARIANEVLAHIKTGTMVPTRMMPPSQAIRRILSRTSWSGRPIIRGECAPEILQPGKKWLRFGICIKGQKIPVVPPSQDKEGIASKKADFAHALKKVNVVMGPKPVTVLGLPLQEPAESESSSVKSRKGPKFRCLQCLREFAKLQTLQQHYFAEHVNTEAVSNEKKGLRLDEDTPRSAKSSQIQQTKSKTHECEYCPRTYWSLQALNQHTRVIHLGRKISTCGFCDFISLDKAKLLKHEKGHERKSKHGENLPEINRQILRRLLASSQNRKSYALKISGGDDIKSPTTSELIQRLRCPRTDKVSENNSKKKQVEDSLKDKRRTRRRADISQASPALVPVNCKESRLSNLLASSGTSMGNLKIEQRNPGKSEVACKDNARRDLGRIASSNERKCKICRKSFPNDVVLAYHFATVHDLPRVKLTHLVIHS